jgi:hypothetical protein
MPAPPIENVSDSGRQTNNTPGAEIPVSELFINGNRDWRSAVDAQLNASLPSTNRILPSGLEIREGPSSPITLADNRLRELHQARYPASNPTASGAQADSSHPDQASSRAGHDSERGGRDDDEKPSAERERWQPRPRIEEDPIRPDNPAPYETFMRTRPKEPPRQPFAHLRPRPNRLGR